MCVHAHTRVLSRFCLHWGAQSRKCSLNPRFTQIFSPKNKAGTDKRERDEQRSKRGQNPGTRLEGRHRYRVRARAAPAESRRHNLQVPLHVRVLEEGRLCEQLQVREFGHQMTQCRKYRFLCSGGDDLRRSGRDSVHWRNLFYLRSAQSLHIPAGLFSAVIIYLAWWLQ